MLNAIVVALLAAATPVKSAPAAGSSTAQAQAGQAQMGTAAPAGSTAKAGPSTGTSATTPAAKAKPMSPEVKSLVDRMQAFYEKTQDFTANFTQTYHYKMQHRTQTSSGTVIFKKPALMRWDYLQPAPKTFVLSGEKVFAYDPQAMTLTKGTIGSDQLSASVTFLWGKGKLADEFSIAEASCKTCAGKLLELTPLRPDPRFKQVRFEVDPKTAQVLRSIVVDKDGSENEIKFSDLKTNTGVAKERFELNPPADVQIVDLNKLQMGK